MKFKIGIIADWLRLPFKESMEVCKKMGADGVQLYAVEGEMAPENMTRLLSPKKSRYPRQRFGGFRPLRRLRRTRV